jgi:hypothetical protein
LDAHFAWDGRGDPRREETEFKMNGDLADELTCIEWLGVLKGRRGKQCRPEVKESLMRGHARGVFTMDDVPEHGAVLTDTMKAFWHGVFERMRAQGDAADDHTGGGYLSFLVWVETRVEAEDEQDVGMTAVAERDCAAQGATSKRDLARFCLGMYLGRWATSEDIKGMTFGAPPQSSQGARAALKSKAVTWDTATEQAKKEGDLGPLETHISRMLGHWAMSEEKFAIKASYTFNRWWMGVKRANNNDVDAILGYVGEYFSLYAGRGLPVEHDGQIQSAISAKRMSAVLNGKAESWAAGKKKEEEGISLEVLAKKMSALMELAQATASKVESMRPYEKPDRRLPIEERQCFHCGEMGHQYAACPRKA